MKPIGFFNRVIMISSLMIFQVDLMAQVNDYKSLPSGLSDNQLIDSIDTHKTIIKPDKNYLIPITEVIGINLSVWSVSKFITNKDFADISWSTMKNNLKMGFVWDTDSYLTNQFMHPFHGANYFNSARSNGLNFWESVPYSLGGSLMWEYFMETEQPSYNDFVNTSVSGITLGEISYRVSNLIIDESTTGIERVVRELSSTIINPIQGFNRFVRGEMWRQGIDNTNPNIHFTFASGVHNVFYNNSINDRLAYFSLQANLDYGNLFSVSEHKNPFDYFTLHTETNIRKGIDIFAILASGVLTDKNITLFAQSKNIIGIYKEIEILYNDVYKFSTTSVTAQLINTIQPTSVFNIQNYAGISAIILGATNSIYANETGKDYNLGPGISGKLGIKLKINDVGEFYIRYKRNWIHTLNGTESEEFIGLLNTGISFNFYRQSYLGAEFLIYERYGDYSNYPDTKDSNSALRFFIYQNI